MVWSVRFNMAVSKGSSTVFAIRNSGETRLRIFAGMVNPPVDTYRSYGCFQLLRGDLSGVFPGFHIQEHYEINPDGVYIPQSLEAGVARFWLYERKYVASGYQMIVVAEPY